MSIFKWAALSEKSLPDVVVFECVYVVLFFPPLEAYI